MSSPIVPIRAGVTPELDAERELIDYCASKVRRFIKDNGTSATRVAIVLLGKVDEDNHAFATYTWDMLESRPASEIRGHAALLLMRG